MAVINSSAVDRPLPVRWRKDMAVWQHRFGDEAYWIVQDPFALRYFRLRPEELALLRMLDGKTSLEEICGRYNRDYAPLRLSPVDLLRFACQAVRGGLLSSDLPGVADRLAERRRQRGRELRKLALQTPWNVPLGTVNPRGMVRAATLLLGPWLSWWGFAGLMLLMAIAGLAFAINPARASEGMQQALWRLPWGWLLLAWWLILHAQQLATAVLLQRFGGECRLLRLHLYYLVPCVVTPAMEMWQTPRKSHRLAIDTAGLGVGLAVGAVAFLGWRLLPSGAWQRFALSLWVVAVLLLGLHQLNPISGGHASDVLSDLFEQPNLFTRGLSGLQARWIRILRLSTADEPRRLPAWILWNAVARSVWQWLLACLILRWAALRFVQTPEDTALLVLTALAVVRLIVLPIWRLRQLYWIPGRMWEVSTPRRVMVGLLAGMLALVLWGPVPHTMELTGDVRPSIHDVASMPLAREDRLQVAVRLTPAVARSLRLGQPLQIGGIRADGPTTSATIVNIRLSSEAIDPVRMAAGTAPRARTGIWTIDLQLDGPMPQSASLRRARLRVVLGVQSLASWIFRHAAPRARPESARLSAMSVGGAHGT